MWNGTMFVDLDWPLNASSLLSASAELLVYCVTLCVIVVFAVAWCLSVHPSIMLVHIVKLLSRPGNPSLFSFLTPCANTQFQGEPIQRGHKIQGGGEILRFSTEIAVYLGKQCMIGRWLLWNVNRKSWVADR